MKNLTRFTSVLFLIGSAIFPAHAAFTSLYVFGDCLSAGTTNQPVGIYYGDRYSNGRVWVEVLAQRQGLVFNLKGNTNSFFGNTSGLMLSEVNSFVPPKDAANALVVIWVNNADMYYPATDSNPSLTKFNAVINQAQANHYAAITSLYAKGIRTLIMTNVVDLSTVPAFNANPNYTSLFHQASLNYNAAFTATLNKARANCPGLTIYVPDFYTLLANLLAHPASYGVTNILGYNGKSIDASDAQNVGMPVAKVNGFGTNCIFWDPQDPTAMVHNWMANLTQQLISPAQISQLNPGTGIDQLNLGNVPVGQNGFVESCTNLAVSCWISITNFNSIAPIQSIVVNAPPLPPVSAGSGGSGSGGSIDPNNPGTNEVAGTPAITAARFYRLQFPVTWQWP